MDRQAVNSTNLASVGYAADTQTLEIEFHHGGVYQYSDVPPTVHEGLLQASSLGSFFQRNIRGSYHYRRVN